MTDPKPAPLLGRLAVHLKMISMDQLAEAVRAQGRAGEDAKLGEILVERGFIDRGQLAKLIAAQQQVIAKQKGEGGARGGAGPRRAPAPAPAPTPRGPTAPQRRRARAATPRRRAPTPRPPRARSRSEARPISPPRPTPTARASKRILRRAIERGASDVHLHEGSPVRIRIAGRLTPDGDATLDREAAERMVLSFLDAGAARGARGARRARRLPHLPGHRPLPREPLPRAARPRRRVPLHLGDAADARAARPAGAAREVHDLSPGHGAWSPDRRAAASRRRWPRS